MQIKNLITVILLFSSFQSFAQFEKGRMKWDEENFFRIGAKGGVNINKVSGKTFKQGFNYNYQLGAFMQFNFSNRFGLQPEVNFVQTSAELSNELSEVYDDLVSGNQKKAKMNYLEIPILLNINVGASKHVKLQLGPSYGMVLKQANDSLKAGGNLFKKSELAAIGGVWIQLPIINLGARYRMGLSDINAIDNKQSWKSQSFQIFVGITF
mgnify:CR=1 FL=1